MSPLGGDMAEPLTKDGNHGRLAVIGGRKRRMTSFAGDDARRSSILHQACDAQAGAGAHNRDRLNRLGSARSG